MIQPVGVIDSYESYVCFDLCDLTNRFKALELIVKKVLSQTDAAEFLVAFAGIQDSIHQIGKKVKMLKGPVSLPLKSLGSS